MVQVPPGKGRSSRIGAGGKATTCLKPSMERVVKRLRECAGCNASKRRAGLEPCDVEADLALLQGKLALLGKRATGTQRFHRGSDDGTGHVHNEIRSNTGDPI